MIEALIFDLDNCLAPAMEIGSELYEPALKAIQDANLGTLSSSALDAAIHDIWSHPFDWVADKHGFSVPMLEAGMREFAEIETQGPLFGYGDLSALDSFDMPLFLVTSGFRRLQESKVRALGIVDRFQDVFVDALDEPDTRLGKKRIIQGILDTHSYAEESIVVIGDSPHSEIKAAKELGIRSVQTLRPGVKPTPVATYRIENLGELPALLESLDLESLE
ncbi:MAG TPA: HAD family hydrolase [Opitutae bacterium]|nr:haloacid dehalogenase [Opitutaceae bacterium]HCR29525.1 HAD family hydrolase [Opitutae bacterium]|tara:strand:+ start:1787 stop:2446 length:660 start_codon:yes stop_codon:yes gene_type:complete